MTTLAIITIAFALHFTVCGILSLRAHNKFMRELENRQKLRREKAERLKGMNLTAPDALPSSPQSSEPSQAGS